MNSLGLVSVVLILVGLYGVLSKANLLKIVIGVALMVLGVACLIAVAGSSGGSVSPVAQAVAVVAVVGGASVVALLAVTAVRLHEKYGSLDIREMRRLKG